MKIQSIDVYPYEVDRQYGTVIASEGGDAKNVVAASRFLFVRAETDNGIISWGEISDIEGDEGPTNLEQFTEQIREFMTGRSVFDVQSLHRDIPSICDRQTSFGSCLSCALDMVMYDAQGQATGRPVYDLLGGAVRNEVTISWVAYIRSELDLIREEIQEKVAQGFRAFKLKVGVDIDLDEERVAVAREISGPEVSIKVDANEGWSVSEAADNIKRLDKYDIAGVESPVPRAEPADIAVVKKQVDVPILEHVQDMQYAIDVLKHDAVDVFNVATTGAGGLWPARQIVTLAEAAGVGVLLGSTVELGPGTLAQLHLAATVTNLTLPSDLVGPGLYLDDVLAEPLQYKAGKLHIPSDPGLGTVMGKL